MVPRKFFNLLEGEKVIEQIKPLKVLQWYLFLKYAIGIIIVLFFFSLGFIVALITSGGAAGLSLAFIIFIIILVGIWLLARNAYGYRYYWITNKRIIYKRGILGYRISSIPLERISDVTISRTFLERIFGFGSVQVQSLAGQYSHGRHGAEGALTAVPHPEKTQETIFKLIKSKRKSEHITF